MKAEILWKPNSVASTWGVSRFLTNKRHDSVKAEGCSIGTVDYISMASGFLFWEVQQKSPTIHALFTKRLAQTAGLLSSSVPHPVK